MNGDCLMHRNLIYRASRVLIKIYVFLMHKYEIFWQSPLPAGPKLFIANHPSGTDPFLIHLVSEEPVSTLIIRNAFDVPVFGAFLRRVKQIPVDPENGEKAFEKARRYLSRGRSVAIFPEGDFSLRGGGLRAPRSGAARLALSTGVPVIPVGIFIQHQWSYRIVSGITGKRTVGYWYLHGPYSVTVGDPMEFTGDPADRRLVDEVSEEMMNQISLLHARSQARWRLHGKTGVLNDVLVWMRILLRKWRSLFIQ